MGMGLWLNAFCRIASTERRIDGEFVLLQAQARPTTTML